MPDIDRLKPPPHILLVDPLREPKENFRVAHSFAEAREHLPDLAKRNIGGLCLRGCHTGIVDLVDVNAEIYSFMEEVADVTRGSKAPLQGIQVRRLPRERVGEESKITIFNEDIPLHMDGYYTEEATDDGLIVVHETYKAQRPEFYRGVGHHLTIAGKTGFIIDRLSEQDAAALREHLATEPDNVSNWNRLQLQGERLILRAGDYLALHQYPVTEGPAYLHGSVGSSPDRMSICYSPYDIMPARVPAEEVDFLYDMVREPVIA